ncbi:GNAT family N-acetyltransferase [Kribbella italica]|uniref:GNAT superfamily N-acetyltransferase n=1 Tax=Kribbella italica TaxID=1540520 RepID=A0A7W9JGL1_9ACTN|nr:GNAT family N-acetyltransferase [Kribbella italica]MBB5841407.1 GNAT superfamily N-acetyltransferase [Kribbella italica]
MIEVRRATPADGTAVGEIHAASWAAAYAPFFTEAFSAGQIQSRRTRWHDRLLNPQGTVLLALVDTHPAAMTWLNESETRPGVAEILSFYAHPNAWGTGAAPTLMTQTLQTLRSQGFPKAHLWTLQATPQSRRFYTRSGFTETGRTQSRDFGDGNPLAQVEYERQLVAQGV